MKQNKTKNKYRTYYLLLLFSNKIRNSIASIRIEIFRKIVNCLLINIIDKNKYNVKNKSKIYSFDKINDVEKKICNIIIDFLMYK